MRLYGCVCGCGKYRTAHDMTLGVAEKAAMMHIMNVGYHRVEIFLPQTSDSHRRIVAVFKSPNSQEVQA